MTSGLTIKLQMKAGQRLAVVNAPEGMAAVLATRLPEVTVGVDLAEKADGVLVFVRSVEEASRLVGKAIEAAGRKGLVWVAYPKGGSGVETDLNRDVLWKVVEPSGWRPVRLVALDEVWSAMRLRPADLVGR